MYRHMIAVGLLGLTATASEAAVIDFTTGEYEGAITADGSTSGVLFDWDATDAEVAAFFAFEADGAFNLTLESYEVGDGVPESGLSGYVLERTDGLNGAILTDGVLTTDNSGCGNFLFDVVEYDSCNQVSFTGFPGSSVAPTAEPGDLLFSGLDAGYYRLKFVESGIPVAGSSSFGISDANIVPLPASGLLMFGALGMLALRGRKRSS